MPGSPSTPNNQNHWGIGLASIYTKNLPGDPNVKLRLRTATTLEQRVSSKSKWGFYWSVSPRSWSKIEILRPNLRPTESGTLEAGSRSLCFWETSRWLWCILKFENHWSTGIVEIMDLLEETESDGQRDSQDNVQVWQLLVCPSDG